jgi:hypothetical protein
MYYLFLITFVICNESDSPRLVFAVCCIRLASVEEQLNQFKDENARLRAAGNVKGPVSVV